MNKSVVTQSRIVRVVRTDTRFGPLWIFDEDLGCSRVIKEYGEYSEVELALMRSFITPESIVVDAGANIGAFTIPLAHVCKMVYAIEPQAEVREVLERNVADYGLDNVAIVPYALGDKQETRYYTPNPLAVGSIRMEESGPVSVETITLDDLRIHPDFIKADVEGMEAHLLVGGRKTIETSKPYILAERQRDGHLDNVLKMLDYTVCTVDLPIFVVNNWKRNPINHFPNMAHIMTFASPTLK